MSIQQDTFNETWLKSVDQQLDSYNDYYRYRLEKNLPNIYRERRKVRPQKLYGSTLGARFLFKIPMNNGRIADLKIMTNISTAGDNTDADRYTGQLLYKEIILRTARGTVLCWNTPEYMIARLDCICPDKKPRIENSVKEDVSFNANTVQVFSQPFFYFLEDSKTTLDSYNLEQLYLELSVADTTASMGFSNDLTSIDPYLIVEYHKFVETDDPSRNSRPKFYKQLNMLAYDIFQEPGLFVASGSTSASLYVTCKYPVFNCRLSCMTSARAHKVIDSFSLYQDERPIVDTYDRRSDYLLLTENEESDASTTTISYWFSVQKEPTYKTGALPLSDKHTYRLEVNFLNALDADSYVYCDWTYWYPLTIDKDGLVDRLDVV
jgi:hypothetical protein